MDVQSLLPDYYRREYRELLQQRSSLHQFPNHPLRPALFADVYTPGRTLTFPPAPQDLGETKHQTVDEKRTLMDNPSPLPVREPQDKSGSPHADSAYKYILAGTYTGPRLDTRKRMEALVRRAKKNAHPCPHRTSEGLCSAPFIRCGDRVQFALRETRSQMGKPHSCGYRPDAGDHYVMIVDEDAAVREFCAGTLRNFFHLAQARIFRAQSQAEALQRFNQNKIEGKSFSLALIDLDLPRMGGYNLMQELFERNYNLSIIALKSGKQGRFAGQSEVLSKCPLVRYLLIKPFHSDILVDAARKILFDRPLPG